MRNRSFVQLALVDEGRKSVILDIAGYPPGERVKNQIGVREALPKQYGDAPEYTLVVAGGDTDIKPVPGNRTRGADEVLHGVFVPLQGLLEIRYVDRYA